MIISAKIIGKPRKPRHCETCGCQINGKQLRLYGYAETTDPPYVIYVHPFACTYLPSPLDNPDVDEALKRNSSSHSGSIKEG